MKINKKFKNIILILIGIGLLICIVIFIYRALIEDQKNPIGIENSPPGNYLHLFNDSAKQKLTINNVGSVYLKMRDTVSFFRYDKIFNIEVTKIRVGSEFNVKKDIIENYTIPTGGTDTNLPEHENNLIVSYKAITLDTAKQIYLSLVGDSITTVVKNDSLACCYLDLKDLIVRYRQDRIFEIQTSAQKYISVFYKKQPIEVAFLRKHHTLYFIVLTTTDDDQKLDHELLYRLIKVEYLRPKIY